MRWTVEQLERATGGSARPQGPQRAKQVAPVVIDSRQVAPGALFVPIVAERDGHAFIPAAVDAGAAAYFYEPPRHDPDRLDATLQSATPIAVPGTADALLDIGRAARARLQGAVVVGITGSVGKTSTKDLTAAAVGAGRRVAASERSFNNELGVPLTLANAAEDAEVAVIEMGARGVGHIAMLCAVAHPTVAVVTAVAGVHLELFGTIEAVAQGKGELVEALPDDGLAVLNGDDPRVSAMGGRTRAGVLRYGIRTAAVGEGAGATAAHPLDVVAMGVELDEELRPSFTLRSPWGAAPVRLGVRGAHQVGNALAALAVALHAGVPLEAAAAALAGAGLSPWRMELSTAPSGAVVLNDAYNANPTSTVAALRSLAALGARRRVAVLGTMAELGPGGPAEHREVAEEARRLGIEVLAVGTGDYGPGVPAVAGVAEAVGALGPIGDGDAVLVKGSRVAGLERLAAVLLGTGDAGTGDAGTGGAGTSAGGTGDAAGTGGAAASAPGP